MTRLKPTLNICILDPLHEGSHAHWAKGVQQMWKQQGHKVELRTLPGRHWKWRMHGAATTWALEIRREASLEGDRDTPDLIITTDMCDAAQLRGLLPPAWSSATFIVYFHENQLTFPWSTFDDDASNGRSHTYGYINITSALAADAVWFNSKHHRDVFLIAAEAFVGRLPKPRPVEVAKTILDKSSILPIGFNLPNPPSLSDSTSEVSASLANSVLQTKADDQAGSTLALNLPAELKPAKPPLVIWNHRWSDDKGTQAFAAFARCVVSEDIPAQFAFLGRAPERLPDEWNGLKDDLGSRCIHWGYVEDETNYHAWLERADIAPIHPRQEYFGISIMEAMASGTIPWVPEAHAYVETMPRGHRFLSSSEWVKSLAERAYDHWPLTADDYRRHAGTFTWSALTKRYDDAMLQALERRKPI
ncbi:MAG: DUF3524 domain-containing protein [Bacteroidetes bacterium]|nr:DUF3524 domain-containing protein [Bacteroidota bacterium]MDA1241711.1 DUF3524 domain-containing protein [Bacteroidota bacterium]